MPTQVFNDQNPSPGECFLITLGETASQSRPVGEFLTLGRDTGNQVPIDDAFVSARHARIERKENGYLLRDLRSRNGTFINGIRISEAYLKPGDRIKIGSKEFSFQNEIRKTASHPFLKSKNEYWQMQLQSVPVFAQTDLPVLLLGTSGSGKEVLARLIHDFSKRSEEPFVSVNCSALTESLVESELFGHSKGSFTGATHDRKGAFEAARGGTLFLDEIGDLPLSLQPKLLRALENKEIRPVGSDKTISTDVRVIAATHQNLQMKIQQGLFRSDLFFRLHVIKMVIPSLADRIEDFEDLIYTFGREMRVAFSFNAVEELKKHSWPGNIRELKNVVARASALIPGTRVEPEHLKRLLDTIVTQELPSASGNMSFIKEIEREMIRQRLLANKGNQRKTAADLNMPKSTLHDRMKQYGISVEEIMKEVTLTGF